jgi:hypothetical protein
MAKSTNPGRVAGGTAGAVVVESVADILERELDAVIQEWLARVDKEPELTAIPLSFEERRGHLPQLLRDVIVRLRLDDERRPTTEIYAPNRATRWPWPWRNLGCSG